MTDLRKSIEVLTTALASRHHEVRSAVEALAHRVNAEDQALANELDRLLQICRAGEARLQHQINDVISSLSPVEVQNREIIDTLARGIGAANAVRPPNTSAPSPRMTPTPHHSQSARGQEPMPRFIRQ